MIYKSTIRICILIVLVSLFADNAYAQLRGFVPDVNTEFMYIEPIIGEDAQAYLAGAKETLILYMQNSTFEDGGNFSLEKYARFSELFSRNAVVTNYLVLNPVNNELIEFTDYIYRNLDSTNKGLALNYRSAEIFELTRNASGDIVAKFSLTKEVFTYEDKRRILDNQPRSREIELLGEMVFLGGSSSSARIVSLKAETKSSSSGSFSFVQGGFTYQVGRLSEMNEFGFQDVAPEVSSYGAFLSYSKALGKSNKWFLWAGATVDVLDIVTNYSGRYNLEADGRANFTGIFDSVAYFVNDQIKEDNVKPSVVFVDNIVEGEETLRQVLRLSGILGIRYKWDISAPLDLIVSIGAMPSFTLPTENGIRNTFFSGVQLPQNPDGTLTADPRFPSLEEINSYGLREDYELMGELNEQRIETTQSNFSLAALMNIDLTYRIGKNWGLSFGVNGMYGLSNLLHFSGGVDEQLLGRGSGESISILEDYARDTQVISVGAQVGVYYQFGQKFR